MAWIGGGPLPPDTGWLVNSGLCFASSLNLSAQKVFIRAVCLINISVE